LKIHFERSGGFAGITTKSEITDSDLPLEDQKQLEELMKKIKNMKFEESNQNKKGVDCFQYHIIIEDDNQKYVIDANENQMNSELRILVDFLEKKC
jgi:hypothetical protein